MFSSAALRTSCWILSTRRISSASSLSTSILLPLSSCRCFGAASSSRKDGKKKKTQYGGTTNSVRKKRANRKSKEQHPRQLIPREPKQKKEDLEFAVPPAICTSTGSPHVYIAGIALENSDGMNAKDLFANFSPSSSSSVSSHSFEYFPPHSFRHELPDPTRSNNSKIIPEIAVLGRSNVGKSSLINALMKKKLAKCSKHPGRTQQVYYYGLVPNSSTTGFASNKKKATKDDNATSSIDPYSSIGFIVDLPGYGYAKAPAKSVDQWQDMTQQFLLNRRDVGTLQHLFILIDARRGISIFDQSIMRWFDDAQIPYSCVVTKSDCVRGKNSFVSPQIVKVVNEICWRYHRQTLSSREHQHDDYDDYNEFGSLGPLVYVTSSKTGDGIHELLSSIEAEFLVSHA